MDKETLKKATYLSKSIEAYKEALNKLKDLNSNDDFIFLTGRDWDLRVPDYLIPDFIEMCWDAYDKELKETEKQFDKL